MAVFDPNAKKLNEEDQNAGQDQGISSVAPVSKISTGGGAAGSEAPSATKQPGFAQKQGTSSGRFTDLRKYMAANQKGTQNMASGVAGNVENQIGQANTAIGTEKDTSTQGIAAGVKSAQDLQGTATKTVNDFTNNGSSDNFESNLTAGVNAGKTAENIGKTGLSNLQGLTDKTLGVEETGRLAGTQEGRGNLLQQQAKAIRPTYNKGMNALDTGLFGGNKEAVQKLGQVAAQTGTVRSNLNQASTDVGNAAKQGATDISTGDTNLKTLLGTTSTNEIAKLQAQADTKNAEEKAAAGEINNDEAINALTAANYKIIGNGNGAGVDMGNGFVMPIQQAMKYITGNQTSEANTGNIDPLKLAKINIMNRLGGNAEVAATADTPYSGGSTNTLNQDFNTKKADLDAQIQTVPGLQNAANIMPSVPQDQIDATLKNSQAFAQGAVDNKPGDSINAIQMADPELIQQLLGTAANGMSPQQINNMIDKQSWAHKNSHGQQGMSRQQIMTQLASSALDRMTKQKAYNAKQAIYKKVFG